MTGDIIRAITLATYGTAFFKHNYDISALTLEHPSFIFENKVEFLFYKKHFFSKPTWHQYADNPINWLKKLKDDGCTEIRLIFQADNSTTLSGSKVPDYKLASFVGGGGNRFIQTVFQTHSDLWQSREEVTDRDAPNNRIWTVSYGRVAVKQQTPEAIIYDIEEIKNRLRNKLVDISSFAKYENLSSWAEWFDKAITLIDAPYPFENSNDKLMVPADKIHLETLQLLAGSGKAWCFGGMGSWNDIGFSDKQKQKTYERLTSQLYEIVNSSYIAIANSYSQKISI